MSAGAPPHRRRDDFSSAANAALLAASQLAAATGAEIQSVEERGRGVAVVLLIGRTPWRVQLDPIERRTNVRRHSHT